MRDGHNPPETPIATPMWNEHKETLARVLATAEWDMLAGSYQNIDLYNDDPLYDIEWWSDGVSEMHGGSEALGDYLDGHSERKLRKLRLLGGEERRRTGAATSGS